MAFIMRCFESAETRGHTRVDTTHQRHEFIQCNATSEADMLPTRSTTDLSGRLFVTSKASFRLLAVTAQSPSRWMLIFVLSLFVGHVNADDFRVEQVETHLVDGVYLLNTRLKTELGEDTLEALYNGVPLTIVMDIEIVKNRDLLWDERIASLQGRYQLQLHALSDHYILKNLNSGATRTFRNLDSAILGLGTISDFPMIDSYLLNPNQQYWVRVRARLDIEALPSPLRPLAYLRSLWELDSDWYTWPIEG